MKLPLGSGSHQSNQNEIQSLNKLGRRRHMRAFHLKTNEHCSIHFVLLSYALLDRSTGGNQAMLSMSFLLLLLKKIDET